MLALILAGHNGFKLMSFINPELPGHSRIVMMVKEKWQQFETKASRTMTDSIENISLDQIFAKSAPASRKQEIEILKPKPRPVKTKKIKVKLPSLTGILRISDARGNVRSLAVIEGKNLAEGDRVKKFVVKKIRKDGIVLARGGASWFVPAPKVQFSLDQGG